MRPTMRLPALALAVALTAAAPARPNTPSGSAPTATASVVGDLGAHWTGQQFLDDGSVVGRTGSPDVPNTIAATLALAATGHVHPLRDASVAWVRDRVDDYVRDAVDDYAPVPTTGGDRPGPLGNLLLFVHVTGEDPRDFGGHDLVARLEASEVPVGTEAGSYGRAVDVFGHTYAHATAVLGLAVTPGAAPSAAAVAHLVDLQCATGGFASGYRTAVQRVTDDCTGDTNATGLALAALALVDEPAASDAAERAVAFLAAHRTEEGGWPYTPGGQLDGNSTGLAALGMRTAGADVAGVGTALAGLQFGCNDDPAHVGGLRFVASDGAPNSFATFQGLLGLWDLRPGAVGPEAVRPVPADPCAEGAST